MISYTGPTAATAVSIGGAGGGVFSNGPPSQMTTATNTVNGLPGAANTGQGGGGSAQVGQGTNTMTNGAAGGSGLCIVTEYIF
jgi:hypothetical protein